METSIKEHGKKIQTDLLLNGKQGNLYQKFSRVCGFVGKEYYSKFFERGVDSWISRNYSLEDALAYFGIEFTRGNDEKMRIQIADDVYLLGEYIQITMQGSRRINALKGALYAAKELFRKNGQEEKLKEARKIVKKRNKKAIKELALDIQLDYVKKGKRGNLHKLFQKVCGIPNYSNATKSGIEALEAFGIEFILGNDAPRGGKAGDYIKITMQGSRRINAIKKAFGDTQYLAEKMQSSGLFGNK